MLALSRILFGGWRIGGGKSRWRGRMRRNWHGPSREERERFKDAVRARYAPSDPSIRMDRFEELNHQRAGIRRQLMTAWMDVRDHFGAASVSGRRVPPRAPDHS